MHTGATGIVGTIGALAALAGTMLTATIICGAPVRADPAEDEQFLALLDQQGIPAVDGVPKLIDRAHRICAELDSGTPADAIIEELNNTTYEDNPTLRLMPNRVNRTSTKFVIATVDAYCPGNRGRLP